METRKITIVNTRDQKKHVVETDATTLGELKSVLNENQINYSDMDFIEALTKTQLRGDDSLLPHDVPYNHTITNELVMVLTVPNRKIKSGMTRGELYDVINSYDDSDKLKNDIKLHFGRNYTMVSNGELEAYLENLNSESTPEQCCENNLAIEQKVDNLYDAVRKLADVLDNEGLDVDEVYDLLDSDVNECCCKDKTVYSAGMSVEDIDELVSSI